MSDNNTASGNYLESVTSPTCNLFYNYLVGSLDAAGNPRWLKQGTGCGDDESYGLAVNAATGETFVSGFLSGASTSVSGGRDVMLMEYDSNGHLNWSGTGIGTSVNSVNVGLSIATDNGGCVYMAGSFTDTSLSFNGFPNPTLSAPAGKQSMLIAKYCPACSHCIQPYVITAPATQIATGPASSQNPITFTVVVGGTQPISFLWVRNGVTVSSPYATASSSLSANNTTTGTLTLTGNPGTGNVDNGTYTVGFLNPCVGDFAFWTTPVGILRIDIENPTKGPVITQLPLSQTNVVGSSVTFSVIATGAPPVSYQWRFNLTNILSGATNATYTVFNAQAHDAGAYDVVVANASGSVTSSSAGLIINGAPDFAYPVNIHTGLNLIANQLDHGSNTLDEIMPGVPDGCVLYKYENASGTWIQSFINGGLGWGMRITLNPGEGAFLWSPTNFTLNFTGHPHVPVLPVSIPIAACYLLSRQTNDLGSYESIVGSAPTAGATAYQWTGSNYATATFSGSAWSPSAPVVAVGEALWIAPSGGSPPPLPNQPVITQPPVSITATSGFPAQLTAGISSSGPTMYLWSVFCPPTRPDWPFCGCISTSTWRPWCPACPPPFFDFPSVTAQCQRQFIIKTGGL